MKKKKKQDGELENRHCAIGKSHITLENDVAKNSSMHSHAYKHISVLVYQYKLNKNKSEVV